MIRIHTRTRKIFTLLAIVAIIVTCIIRHYHWQYIDSLSIFLSRTLDNMKHTSGSDDIERQLKSDRSNFIKQRLVLAEEFKSLRFESVESYHRWRSNHPTEDLIVLTISVANDKYKRPTLKLSDIATTSSSSLFLDLQQLRLHQMGIKDIELGMFSKFSSLRLLSLQRNNLQSINTEDLKSLSHLQVLDLRYNKLTSIDMTFLNMLLVLDVSHNPLTTVSNMRLGRNTPTATFAFKNTTIDKIDFCFDHMPNSVKSQTNFAKFYVGVGHTIKCSCAFEALQQFLVGNNCVRISPLEKTCDEVHLEKWLCQKLG